MRVKVEITEALLDGDFGDVPGVIVNCTRCHSQEESFGTSENSVKRCLALLREGCPMNESNFYVAEGMLCPATASGPCSTGLVTRSTARRPMASTPSAATAR